MLTAASSHRSSPRQPRTLWSILAARIAITTVIISAVLIAFFFVKYMLDTPQLRRATLEAESTAITAAIFAARDPSKDKPFRSYPRNYGFRAFDHSRVAERHVVSEANPDLLPPLSTEADVDLSEGFFDLERLPVGGQPDRWLLNDRDTQNGRTLWVQVVMIGDPAWRWQRVILTELLDHVFVPMALIVPLLTLASLLSISGACRQLGQLGTQAEALGAAVLRGKPLQKLPDSGLPRELTGLVGAINTMLFALSRVLAAQREFSADAAHELRTPLAMMTLQLAEIPQGEARNQLAQGLADMSRLIGQLLRLAQVESAMLSTQATVDLVAASRKVCAEYAVPAIARRQSIDFDAPATAVNVEGNAELIEIAVRNLIENALKVSPAPGTVQVHVSGNRQVIVEDEGPGIPAEIKQVIFTRFWREPKTSKTGSGVGLALVRKIADLHGGDVHVEDRPGGGSRFVLAFSH